MTDDIARDQLENIELGTAILGLALLLMYGIGFIEQSELLMVGLGLVILAVGADELLTRVTGEP